MSNTRVSIEGLLRSLDRDGWVHLGVPGFDAALTKTSWGDTYDLAFIYLPGDDHRFDPEATIEQLAAWMESHRPRRTTGLMVVVFDSAHVYDIQAITSVSVTGWRKSQVYSAVIDLETGTYYGPSHHIFGSEVEKYGLRTGQS